MKQPVPSKAARARSSALLKQVFARELADRTSSGRRALAAKLIDEAAKVINEPTDRFVLLAGATDAGREAGDLALCTKAADVMAADYLVDGLRMKAEVATKMSLRADSTAAAVENCQLALALVDQLVDASEYAAASRVLNVVKPVTAGNSALGPQVVQRAHDVDALRVAADQITNSVERLKTDPADAAANLAVGQFLCFLRGDWTQGLPRLACGSDSKLKGLATAELAHPDDSATLANLADGWWDAATARRDLAHANLIRHAGELYRRALDGSAGLHRMAIEKRLEEVTAFDIGKPVDLIQLIDLKRDTVEGTWHLEHGTLRNEPNVNSRLMIHYSAPEEYDFSMEFTRTAGRDQVFQIFPAGKSELGWSMGAWQNQMRIIGDGRDLGRQDDASCTLLNKTYTSVIRVRRNRVEAWLNGKMIVDYKGDFSHLKPSEPLTLPDPTKVGLGCWYGQAAVFTKIQLTPISGHAAQK